MPKKKEVLAILYTCFAWGEKIYPAGEQIVPVELVEAEAHRGEIAALESLEFEGYKEPEKPPDEEVETETQTAPKTKKTIK